MDSVLLDSRDSGVKSRPLSLERRKNQQFNPKIFWFLIYMEISGQKILLWQRRSSCWGCPDYFESWICCRFPPSLFLMFSLSFIRSRLFRHQEISLRRIVINFSLLLFLWNSFYMNSKQNLFHTNNDKPKFKTTIHPKLVSWWLKSRERTKVVVNASKHQEMMVDNDNKTNLESRNQ